MKSQLHGGISDTQQHFLRSDTDRSVSKKDGGHGDRILSSQLFGMMIVADDTQRQFTCGFVHTKTSNVV